MARICCLIGSSLQSPIPQNTSSSWIFPAVRDSKTSSILSWAVEVGKREIEGSGKGRVSNLDSAMDLVLEHGQSQSIIKDHKG